MAQVDALLRYCFKEDTSKLTDSQWCERFGQLDWLYKNKKITS